MKRKARRAWGMRYTTAYVVKLTTESLALSSVLPLFIVLLLRLSRIDSVTMLEYKSSVKAVVLCVVLDVVLFVIGRLAFYAYPQLVSGIPRQACVGETQYLYRPALRGYGNAAVYAMCFIVTALSASAFSWPFPLAADQHLLLLLAILAVPTLLYYVMVNSVDRVVRSAEGEDLEKLIAEEKEHLRRAHAGVSCWRLSWAGWAVEVLIYAGLSWALWRALASEAIAWQQWWIATGAAAAVAVLRVAERQSPRWAPAGREETAAWGVRLARLLVAAAACV